MRTVTTAEAIIRQGFMDVVRKAREIATEEESLFCFSVIAAAGDLVCAMLKSLGLEKSAMLEMMEELWDIAPRKAKN